MKTIPGPEDVTRAHLLIELERARESRWVWLLVGVGMGILSVLHLRDLVRAVAP